MAIASACLASLARLITYARCRGYRLGVPRIVGLADRVRSLPRLSPRLALPRWLGSLSTFDALAMALACLASLAWLVTYALRRGCRFGLPRLVGAAHYTHSLPWLPPRLASPRSLGSHIVLYAGGPATLVVGSPTLRPLHRGARREGHRSPFASPFEAPRSGWSAQHHWVAVAGSCHPSGTLVGQLPGPSGGAAPAQIACRCLWRGTVTLRGPS